MAYDRSDSHKEEMLSLAKRVLDGIEDGTIKPIETHKIQAGTIKTEKVSNWYTEYLDRVAFGNEDYPELEKRFCPVCGLELVKSSYNYEMGQHTDGCPTINW